MGELKVVATKKLEANEDAVRLLEKTLKLARKGEIIGIAIAGEYYDGCSYTCASRALNKHILISAMAIVQQRMIKSLED